MDGRRWSAPLGVATGVVLVAGLITAAARQGGGGLASEVLARPWPSRVTPTGRWPASIRGTGEHLTIVRAEGEDFSEVDTRDGCPSCGFVSPQLRGRLVGGFSRAAFEFERDDSTNRAVLLFPDGTRWRPVGRFTLDSDADLPIAAVVADGPRLRVATGAVMSGLIEAAGAPLSAQGEFVGADGRKVDRLTLPPGTRAVRESGGSGREEAAPLANLTAVAGTSIVVETTRDTEVAVAGTAHAEALDRTWDGLVAAVQGRGMTASATWGPGGWTVTAESTNAYQLWVDVWPVADTVVTGRAIHDPMRERIRLVWENEGFATSQFYEAEGEGAGAGDVHFRLNESLGHDAGLGVRRRVRARHLDEGDPVDSNLLPGDDAEARVDHGRQPAAVVVRGNFPELRFTIDAPSPSG